MIGIDYFNDIDLWEILPNISVFGCTCRDKSYIIDAVLKKGYASICFWVRNEVKLGPKCS